MNTHEIAENLRRDYEAFINEERHFEFFMLLADYMGYVTGTSELKSIVEDVMREKTKEYDELERLEEASLRELDGAKEKLLKIIESEDIPPDSLKPGRAALPGVPGNVLDLLRRYEEGGGILMGGFKSDNINQFLFAIAVGIAEQKGKSLLKDFLVSDREYKEYTGSDGNHEGSFIFSKTLKERWRKTEDIENAAKMAPWAPFDHLLKFHEAFAGVRANADSDEILRRHDAPCQNAQEGKDAADIIFAAEDVREVMRRSSGGGLRDGDLHYLNFATLRMSAKRVHDNIMKELSSGSLKWNIFPSPATDEEWERTILPNTIVRTAISWEPKGTVVGSSVYPEEEAHNRSKNEKGGTITSIILVEPRDSEERWRFLVNDDYANTKLIQKRSSRNGLWSVLIAAIRANRDYYGERAALPAFNEQALTYFNYRRECPIYFGGRYAQTAILEITTSSSEPREHLTISSGVKTEIISERKYRERLKRKRLQKP